MPEPASAPGVPQLPTTPDFFGGSDPNTLPGVTGSIVAGQSTSSPTVTSGGGIGGALQAGQDIINGAIRTLGPGGLLSPVGPGTQALAQGASSALGSAAQEWLARGAAIGIGAILILGGIWLAHK